MNELRIEKVKIQRKSENGSWAEIGRGRAVGFLQGKNNSFIRFQEFADGKWSNIPLELAEVIPVNAACMRVVKW